MTFQDLKKYLWQHLRGSRLELDDAEETDKAFLPLLFQCRVMKFVIDDCRLTEESREFTATGGCSLQPLYGGRALSAVMHLWIEPTGEIGYRLELSCSCAVSFESLFGGIQPGYGVVDDFYTYTESPLANMLLQHPRLTITSQSSEADLPFMLESGLSFLSDTAKWQSYSSWIPFATRISGGVSLISTAFIGKSARFVLEIPLSGAGLGLVFPSILEQGEIALRINSEEPAPSISIENRYVTRVDIICRAKLQGVQTPIVVSAPLFGSDGVFYFTARFANGLSLPDIVRTVLSLLGLPDIAGRLMLPDSSPLEKLRLFDLDMGFWKGANSDIALRQVSITAGVAQTWKLPLPALTLRNLLIKWSIIWGEDKNDNAYSAVLRAVIAIKLFGKRSLLLSATAQLPEMTLEAHLSLVEDAQKTSLGDIIGDDPVKSLNCSNIELVLAELDLVASPTRRSLYLHASVRDLLSWNVGKIHFVLAKVEAAANFTQAQNTFSLSGSFLVDVQGNPFNFSLSGSYDGTGWVFTGTLSAGTVRLGGLLLGLLGISYTDERADFLLTAFNIGYNTATGVFNLEASFEDDWGLSIGRLPVQLGGQIAVRSGEGDNTFVAALLYMELGAFQLSVQADDFFGELPTYVFQIALDKSILRATYSVEQIEGVKHELVSVQLVNITLGDIVTALIRVINPNHSYRLPAPWNLLNKIDLSRFRLRYDLTDESLSITYNLGLRIPALLEIRSVGIVYAKQETGGYSLRFTIDGTTLAAGEEQNISWDVLKGSPPAAVGNDNRFVLHYIGMGQHFATPALLAASTVDEAVDAMKESFTLEGAAFSSEVEWMLGIDFSVNNMINVRLAFNDPLLYGAVIEVMKGNSPLSAFAGLRLELLYRKISKDVGMFKATLRMPDKYRRFQLGAFTFTIGLMSLELYTNGNFLLDLGFPHGGDFSSSFSLEAGIYCGHGGLYFGVLSGATAANLPVTSRGRFNTVLALGVGLSLGIGRSFDFGIVKAGLSLEVIGIFEGLFAVFEPKDGGDSQLYYAVQATVGFTGRLFVSVDLKIITIQASVTILAYARVTLIASRPMLLELDVSLTMKAYIKILFIKINFSFSFSRHFCFSIGSASPAPWDALPQRRCFMPEGDPFEVVDLGRQFEAQMRIIPVFSLEESGGYCVAFVPVLDRDSFSHMMAMLAEWTLRQWDEGVDRESAEVLTDELMQQIIDFKRLNDFFSLNFVLSLTADSLLRAQQNLDSDGVAIAMPPVLSLLFVKDEEGAQPLLDVDYAAANPVTSAYADSIHDYFETLNPDPNTASRLSTEESDPVPLAQIVFVDYVQMLLREVIGKLHSLFNELKLDASQLPDCEKLCGMTAAAVLEANPGMELCKGKLALTGLRVIVSEGDTIVTLAQHLNVETSAVYEAAAELRQLLRTDTAFRTEQTDFDNSVQQMTVAQGAAYSFVRFREFALQGHYQKTVQQLQQLNDWAAIDWEETAAGGKTLLLPDGRSWKTLPGDTIERIAKSLAFTKLVEGELPEWDSYRAAFVVQNGGDASAIPKQLIIPGMDVRVEGDVSLAAISRRLYPQCASFSSDENPLLGLPLLRQAALMILPCLCSVEEGETVGAIMERTGADARTIAAALLNKPEMIKTSQTPLIVRDAPFVSKPLALSLMADSAAIDTIGAMSSRFLLQGLRLPTPMGDGDTEPFYKLTGQQTGLPETPGDWLIRLSPDAGCAWLHGGVEDPLPWSLIEPELPSRSFDWLSYAIGSEPLSVCCSIPRVFTATSSLTLVEREAGTRRLHLLSDELTACISETDGLRLLSDETIAVETAVLIPFTLLRTGDGDSFSVEGMEVSRRHKLYSLWQLSAQEQVSYSICYCMNPLQLEGTLYRESWDAAKSVFVRSNLSLETHRTPVEVAKGSRVDISTPGTADFLLMLWQCSVVGGGGHMLQLQTAQGVSLPGDIFDDDGRATLWLLAIDSDGRLTRAGITNAAITPCGIAADSSERADFVPVNQGNPSMLTARPTLPAGCIGTALEIHQPENNDTPANRTRRLFSIFSYYPNGTEYPGINAESAPMQPCGSSENDGIWRYEAVFPAWKLVALPEGKERSVYSALGKPAPGLVFGCRDILGNRAQGQLECDDAVPCYNDSLIGIGSWPCVKAGYEVNPGNGGAMITLRLTAEGRGELKQPGIAAAVVRASAVQLEQEDLAVNLHSSLCNTKWERIDKEPLLQYARGMVAYLESGGEAPCYEQSFSFPVCRQSDEPYALTTQLELQRERYLAPDSPADFASVSTNLSPATEAEIFTAALEKAFPQVKLAWAGGEGGSMMVVTTGEGGMLQKMSVSPYTRVSCSNAGVAAPYYHGMRPLANKRMSAAIETGDSLLTGWSGGEKELVYTGIDMDEWSRRLLRDFEELLASREMGRAALQVTETAGRLVMAKEALAEIICQQLVPIEDGCRQDSSEARQLLLDELRRALVNGERFATVAQYLMETQAQVHYRMPVTLCGRDEAAQSESGLHLRPGKLDSTAGSFCLIYSSDDLAQSGFAPEWEPMVTELEYNINVREGGYEQSDWLQFIIPLKNGSQLLDIRPDSDISVPNPLRSCPADPRLIGQSCEFNSHELYRWEYCLNCEAEMPEQDMFIADVAFSVRESLQKNAQQDLFTMLCHYDIMRNDILEQLHSADDKVFECAVNAYADFMDKLVEAWGIWLQSVPQMRTARISCHATIQAVFGEQTELETRCDWQGVHADFAVGQQPQYPGQRASFTLHIPQISIYEYNMAQPLLYTLRNSNLLSLRDGGYIAVDERFIYRSEPVGLPSVYAGREVCGENLFYSTEELPSQSSILNAVRALLTALGLEKQEVDASFAVSCGYSLDTAGLSRIELPLAFFPPAGLVTDSLLAEGIFSRFTEAAPSTRDFSLYFNVAISPRNKTELLLAFTRLRADFGRIRDRCN